MAIFRGDRSAFGAPGIEPQWTHGDKGGVGTAYAASTAHSDRYNSMASVGNPFTILLVDYDEAIRRLIQRILQQQGFHVIEASDGAEALKVASAYAEPVDLLLTGSDDAQGQWAGARATAVAGAAWYWRALHVRLCGAIHAADKTSRIDPTSRAFYSRRADRGHASNTCFPRAAMITAPRDLPGAAGDEASVAQEFVISERFTSALALRRNGRVRDVLTAPGWSTAAARNAPVFRN